MNITKQTKTASGKPELPQRAVLDAIERNKRKAQHAEALAAALRKLRDVSWPDPACAEADAALANWEGANQ